MGYTHYHPQHRDFTEAEWSACVHACRRIVIYAMGGRGEGEDEAPASDRIHLCWEYDEAGRPPQVDANAIRFNGPHDLGCETFFIRPTIAALTEGDEYHAAMWRTERRVFQFTKTRLLPYDEAVTACLIAIDKFAPGALQIGSDGNAEEWAPGLKLARLALPGVELNIPKEV